MTDLKPCPFCGEKDLIDYGIMGGTMKGFDYVQCENCGAEMHSIHNGKYIEAVEAWNRRTESVKEQPSADVVEVVRCKDCEIPHNRFTGCPNLNGLIPPENHFCSYGKRKEGDEE